MAVKIGHASIDERGQGHGGSAGDQTGREVYTREWYPKGWTVLLRPKKASVAEKSAKACETGCANNHIGYDMYQRNSLHTQAKAVGYNLSKVKVDCETDCSAFMTTCAIAAGVKALEYTGNAPVTATMRKDFEATGEYEVLTDSRYLSTDAYLKRGDILVNEGHHTVMILSNGPKAGQKVNGNPYTVPARFVKKGQKGDAVRWVQYELNESGAKLNVDGDFGPLTDSAVRAFQEKHGLEVDGIVGPITKKALQAEKG